jgi:putative thioredoxin
MTAPNFIFDATADNFAELVLENSRRGPVLVNFWAPWAGPCLKLWPTLEKLAADYRGRFLLVNVNTDTHKQLARDEGVNSLPTLKVYRHGRIVEQVHGAESEASLRQLIDRHLISEADVAHARALRAWREGAPDKALDMLADAHRQHPRHTKTSIDYCKALLQAGEIEQARTVLDELSAADRASGPAAVLAMHLDLLAVLEDAPSAAQLDAAIAADPTDLMSRYRRAALHLFEDQYSETLAQLLAILERDPSFRGGAARRAMTALFELLGPAHPLSERYRTLMNGVLF